jgi:bifunctional DNA-binding transcriptional regulator/antitoxin component of YhaV-PrlF toxin-antitoxin module
VYVEAVYTITLTSKRQATLPAVLCEQLGIRPGDKITLERQEGDGKTVWILHGKKAVDWSWAGAGRKYAKGKSHDWDDIEHSIANAAGGDAGS